MDSAFASPETASSSKEPQNEACTACRSVKRRCLHPAQQPGGGFPTCTRCAKLSLDCRYQQEKRGRKPGVSQPASSKKRARHGTVTESPEAAAESTEGPLRANMDEDWLRRDLMNTPQYMELPSRNGVDPNFPIASTSRLELPPAPSLYPPPAAPQPLIDTLGRASYPLHRAVPPSISPYPPATASSTSGASVPGSGEGEISTPTVAMGGFSLKKLLGDRPEETSKPSLADAFTYDGAPGSLTGPEKTFEDVVAAGILPESQVEPLWQFFFTHLNPMTSMLDPDLHTIDFVRPRSPFLFTAILTVATKVAHATLYPPCLKYARMLSGQAFEYGINNIELVQAFATLSFWAEAVDDSVARRLAYTIRSAFELSMHKIGKRPLPTDEYEARLVLNPERTWLYLTIADHRFSTQRSLPRMISHVYRHDPIKWIVEHLGIIKCRHEGALAPLVLLSRLLDMYEALTKVDKGQLPNRDIFDCLSKEYDVWRLKWACHSSGIALEPAQQSLIRFYSNLFRFQIDELQLLFALSTPPSTSSFEPNTSPVLAFGRLIQSALRVLSCLREELKSLIYCFDSIWIGAASAAIWVVQNIAGMDARNRELVLESLGETHSVTAEVSTGPQSMAAYTSRLLEHLINKAKASIPVPPPQPQPQPQPQPLATPGNAVFLPDASPGVFDPQWTAMDGLGVGGGGHAWGGNGNDHDVLFANILRPLHNLGEDLVYPTQDDQLWQSLFPLFGGR